MALQEARKAGEDLGIHAFPVMERVNPNTGQRERTYDPLPFKTLKELKTACAQYRPTSPYTLTILETIASEALPPNDWRAIAKACLSGGDYLLWKSEYDEKAKEQAARNRAAQVNISYEMLVGEGAYADTHNQIQYPLEAYGQINGAGIKAWKKLPTSGQKTEELSKIIQGPDEKYQDFVSRLLQAVGRVVVDGEAGMLIVKQLAYENANTACQAALRPYQRKGTLSDYIRIFCFRTIGSSIRSLQIGLQELRLKYREGGSVGNGLLRSAGGFRKAWGTGGQPARQDPAIKGQSGGPGRLSAPAQGLSKASAAPEAFGRPGSPADSRTGPPRSKAKAGDLAACLLRRKAFRKPPQRRRLSEGLGRRRTASRTGPPRSKAKAGDLAACLLWRKAFQKPPQRRRLSEGLGRRRTASRTGPPRSKAKAGDLAACLLWCKAFRKPPQRRRLSEGLGRLRTASRTGPPRSKAKAGDLAGSLLRRKAFRKPPQRRRLSEGLGRRRTAGQVPRDQRPKRGTWPPVCSGARPFESLRSAGGFRKAWVAGGQPAGQVPRDQRPKRGTWPPVCSGARPFKSLRSAGGFRKAWVAGGQPAGQVPRDQRPKRGPGRLSALVQGLSKASAAPEAFGRPGAPADSQPDRTPRSKAKAGDLAGSLLRRKAFQKPPQRRRLSEGLGHRRTARWCTRCMIKSCTGPLVML
ncbi:hypothetical protein QTO34_017787 [Cnephaeus nilssonii]|uniref:Retroviral nucleocapsid Gag protein p24 C-terminal domain-containing protein n=1 Tax=Cnephaeus nilssonii TaxID=3371016 RepID=A0AA40I1N1_CNENI|nr:hypothetical protein QTO34_017787 [Eptesicus nilssonii]